MIITPTDEQQELSKAVRSLLEHRLPESRLRELLDTPTAVDDELWAGLTDMGLLGITIPEELGGLGRHWSDVGIVLEEAGRALLCVPYYSTAVLGTAALLASQDSAAQARWLPAIAAGECKATAALISDRHGRATSSGTLRASVSENDGWQLDGDVRFVTDGLAADLLIVAAVSDSGLMLFAVEGAAKGLTRVPVPALDLTRKLADLRLDGVKAEPLNCVAGVPDVVEHVLDLAATCLAAEALGGLSTVLDTAVAYAKTRYQFGRPIGSFQAIRHICADMLVDYELSKSAVFHALWAIDQSPSDHPTASCLAKLTACEAYTRSAGLNIQVHGGIGFTWEHSAHLHLKRAKSSQLTLGDGVVQRRRLADLIPIAAQGTRNNGQDPLS